MGFKQNMALKMNQMKTGLANHSPELCLVGGIIMFGVTIVAACKATAKTGPVLDAYNEEKAKIEEAKRAAADPNIPEERKEARDITFTEEDEKQARFVAMRNLGVGLVKTYWPVAVSAAISVGLFLTSYKIINGRLVTAIGAYKALDDSYKKYRDRVADRWGEEAEREVRTGVSKEKGFVKETTPEGDEKVVEKEVEMATEDHDSRVVIFSEYTSKAYRRGDPIYNEAFLQGVESEFDRILRLRGWVLESEVRQRLGVEITEESLTRGWIIDPANIPNSMTHIVDLHIHQLFRETGDMVLSSGRIVKEISGKEWSIEFNTKIISNLIWMWEKRNNYVA